MLTRECMMMKVLFKVRFRGCVSAVSWMGKEEIAVMLRRTGTAKSEHVGTYGGRNTALTWERGRPGGGRNKWDDIAGSALRNVQSPPT